MNIKKLFKKKLDNYYDEPQINQLLLRQMILYALEDKEQEFDLLLNKTNDYWTPFNIEPDYVINTDGHDGNISSVELERDNDYYSYVHFCLQHTPEKYTLKVIENSLNHNTDNYKKWNFIVKSASLVEACLVTGKEQCLEKLLDSKTLNDNDVSNALFLFNYRTLSTISYQVIKENPEDFFNCISQKLPTTYNSYSVNNVFFALENIYNSLDKKRHQKDLLQLVEFLDDLKNKYSSRNTTELCKRIVDSCFVHGVLEFEHKINKGGNINLIEGQNILEIYKIDKNSIIQKRAQKLENDLLVYEDNKIKKIKI